MQQEKVDVKVPLVPKILRGKLSTYEMKSRQWSIDITWYCVNSTCSIPIIGSDYCWTKKEVLYE